MSCRTQRKNVAGRAFRSFILILFPKQSNAQLSHSTVDRVLKSITCVVSVREYTRSFVTEPQNIPGVSSWFALNHRRIVNYFRFFFGIKRVCSDANVSIVNCVLDWRDFEGFIWENFCDDSIQYQVRRVSASHCACYLITRNSIKYQKLIVFCSFFNCATIEMVGIQWQSFSTTQMKWRKNIIIK